MVLASSLMGLCVRAEAENLARVVLMDGYWNAVILNQRRRATGTRGTNIDDIFQELKGESSLRLDSEFTHEEWKRMEYLLANPPEVIVVGIHSFNVDPRPKRIKYSIERLSSFLLRPLSKTKTRFVIYYWNLGYKMSEAKATELFCKALQAAGSCGRRLRLVDSRGAARSGGFPSPQFISKLKESVRALLDQ